MELYPEQYIGLFSILVYSIGLLFIFIDNPLLYLKYHLYEKFTKSQKLIIKESKYRPILIMQGHFYLVYYKGICFKNDYTYSKYIKYFIENEKDAQQVFNKIKLEFFIEIESKKKELEISNTKNKPFKIIK